MIIFALKLRESHNVKVKIHEFTQIQTKHAYIFTRSQLTQNKESLPRDSGKFAKSCVLQLRLQDSLQP